MPLAVYLKIAKYSCSKILIYFNRQGMILLSELSRRRIRSIHKLIKVGRTEIVKVISVDPETGQYLARVCGQK